MQNDFYKKAFFMLLGILIVLMASRFVFGPLNFGNFGWGNVNENTIIKSQNAKNYIGKFCTVEGRIVATYKNEKVCFLNFDRDYKKGFTAVIFKSAFNNFSDSPEVYYKNKTVRVKGLIKEYKGKAEIIINDPSEIEIVD